MRIKGCVETTDTSINVCTHECNFAFEFVRTEQVEKTKGIKIELCKFLRYQISQMYAKE